jgi:hypothetical protein
MDAPSRLDYEIKNRRTGMRKTMRETGIDITDIDIRL